jgi:hypothetical protein
MDTLGFLRLGIFRGYPFTWKVRSGSVFILDGIKADMENEEGSLSRSRTGDHVNTLAMTPAQFTFGQPSFAGSLLSGQTFVDPSTSRRYELVPSEEITRMDVLEDKMLALTAELIRSEATPQDFSSWEKVKADLGL